MFKRYNCIIGLTLIFYGCSVTSIPNRYQFTPLKQNNTKIIKASSVDVYFNNEKLDFEYEKLGYAEIEIEELNKNHSVSYLQDLAWQHGGDAVINTEIIAEKTTNSETITNSNTDIISREKSYTPTKIKGIVVKKIINDSTRKVNKVDTNFREILKNDLKNIVAKYQTTQSNGSFGTFMALLLCALLIVALSIKEF